MQRALAPDASALILVHQHLSGNAELSAADRATRTGMNGSSCHVGMRSAGHDIGSLKVRGIGG